MDLGSEWATGSESILRVQIAEQFSACKKVIGRADTAENSWKFPKKVLKKDPKIGPNWTKKGPFSVVLGSQRGLYTLSSLFPSKKSTNSVQNWFSGY